MPKVKINAEGRSIVFDSVRGYFENKGISNIKLSESNGISSYFTGNKNHQKIGVKFGRVYDTYRFEAECLSTLSHKNIPKCFDIGTAKIKSSEFGYMIVQHFPGRPICLLEQKSRNGKIRIVNSLISVIDLLDYIHSKNVAHHDIHSDHILVDRETCLIDFSMQDYADKAIYDFCSPEETEDMHQQPCYGRMLEEVANSNLYTSFSYRLKDISSSLVMMPRSLFRSSSRDSISRETRESLEKLLKEL